MRTIAWKASTALLAAMAWSGLALAQVHGNPVPSLDEGRLGFGLTVSQYNRDLQLEHGGTKSADFRRTTFQLDYAPAKESMVQGFIGFAQSKPEKSDTFNGQEIGVGFRQTVDVTIPAGDEGIKTALLGTLRYGDLNDGESFNYFQLDIGYGGSYPVTAELAAYAGLLYSEIWGEVGSTTVNSADNLGLFGGVDFGLSANLHLSAELHLLHELGVGIQIQYNM